MNHQLPIVRATQRLSRCLGGFLAAFDYLFPRNSPCCPKKKILRYNVATTSDTVALDSLPVELLTSIIDHLSHQDLASVCLVNKAFYRLSSGPERWGGKDRKEVDLLFCMKSIWVACLYQFKDLKKVNGNITYSIHLPSEFVQLFPQSHNHILYADVFFSYLCAGLSSFLLLLAFYLRGTLSSSATDTQVLLTLSIAFFFPTVIFFNINFPLIRDGILELIAYFGVKDKSNQKIVYQGLMTVAFTSLGVAWNHLFFREYFHSDAPFSYIGEIINVFRIVALTGCNLYGGFLGILWCGLLDGVKVKHSAIVSETYTPFFVGSLIGYLQQHLLLFCSLSPKTCAIIIASLGLFMPQLAYYRAAKIHVFAPLVSLWALIVYGIMSYFGTNTCFSIAHIILAGAWTTFACLAVRREKDDWIFFLVALSNLLDEISNPFSTPKWGTSKEDTERYYNTIRSFYRRLVFFHCLWMILTLIYPTPYVSMQE